MPERPVAIEFLRPFAAVLRESGVDPVPIARESGIIARAGERAARLVGHVAVRRFCELAARTAGDPLFGVHVARARAPGSFGVLEFGMRAAANLGDAMAFFVRFAPLLRDATVTHADRDRGELRIGFAVPHDVGGLGRHAHEYKLAALAALVRDATGDARAVRRAWFCHAAPSSVEPLAAAIAPALRFGCQSSGFAVAASKLAEPVRFADAPLHAYLEKQAAAALAASQDAIVPTYIRDRLRELLRSGEPGLEGLARALHMSPRTLQRRFQSAGSSYHAFVDDTRRELALGELEQSGRDVAAIAGRLGFSSARSFIRAFRRWTGTTPAQYRRRLSVL